MSPPTTIPLRGPTISFNRTLPFAIDIPRLRNSTAGKPISEPTTCGELGDSAIVVPLRAGGL